MTSQPPPQLCRPTVLAAEAAETFAFESNVSRVMDIIINSLYSNKDVFMRELISNAADACDKRRFLELSEHSSAPNHLTVKVSANREANTLTIEDNGVGMSKEDLVQNLGRIAESGTRRFMEGLSKDKQDEVSLIGQFGVGFYSGFLVADKISVVTRKAGGEQWRWEASMANLSQYSVSLDDSSAPIPESGTRITLHLKDESDQYLDDQALKTLIERYSEFIQYPIQLERTVTKPEAVPDEGSAPAADGSVATKTVMTKAREWEVVNTKKPLWLRKPRECSEEDYTEFYKQTFHAYDQPAAHTHFSIEGNVDFKALLFLPSEVPYELNRDMFAESARSLRLYVKRVFINDKFEDLVPRWLLFLRGVVDSDDLPLNVGREILQQSRSLRMIKQRLTKKAIDMIADLAASRPEDYNKFWKSFGRYIKVGIIEEDAHRDELVPLARFSSTHGAETSLPDYVARMPADQKAIYYVVGETKAQAAMSPAVEHLKLKGYEVLHVSEPVDEMTLQNIGTYSDKPIVDAGKENPKDLSEAERREKTFKNEETEELRVWMKQVLGNKIQRVESSSRLVSSPATLVQSEYGVSPTMQKYLRAQSAQEEDGKGNFENIFNQAVLEINPDHPVTQKLRALQQTAPDAQESRELVEIVFNTAALAAGYVLDNSADYSNKVVSLLTRLLR